MKLIRLEDNEYELIKNYKDEVVHLNVGDEFKVLNIDKDLIPVTAITLGYANEQGRERKRKDLKDIVVINGGAL